MYISDGRNELATPDILPFEPEPSGQSFDANSYEDRRMSRKLTNQQEQARTFIMQAIEQSNSSNEKVQQQLDEVKSRLERFKEGALRLLQRVQRLENNASRAPASAGQIR